jgi:hypothetical protein
MTVIQNVAHQPKDQVEGTLRVRRLISHPLATANKTCQVLASAAHYL